MGSWRIVDLDPPDGPRREGGHAALVAALVVVLIVVVNVAAQLIARPAPNVAPELTARPTAAPISTVTSAFAVNVDVRDPQSCGTFTAASPASTFTGAAMVTRRVDTDIVLAGDPDWAWCVAGMRVFDEGVELIGTLGVRGRQRTGGSRPLLRDATFTAEIPGFGALGPSELIDVSGYAVARLRALVDASSRPAFVKATSAADALRLRVEAMAGPWSFDAVPVIEGALAVRAEAHGVRFQLHDLKLLPDAIATTLYTLSDTPDPAIVSFEWDAIDDLGTIYRQLPDRRVAGTLPGFYRAFAPAPPSGAQRIAFSIRRLRLTTLDEFAVDVALK